jgi:ABC-2 type transport system ATP-binding protein
LKRSGCSPAGGNFRFGNTIIRSARIRFAELRDWLRIKQVNTTQPRAILCRGLTKTYPGKPPVEAVRGVDLEILAGECFGVLGPNGAGKTTTIEILEGLLEATTGEVEILGMNWQRDADRIRQRIGVSLQETELSERLTVLETLTLFRSFYPRGITPQEAMARVSLEEKANSWVKKLSGGQKQRLAVATALVGEPDLIFLDEPTTGLDPSSRRQLWEIIQGFTGQGRTVLLTTHYMDEAERLCDRVAIFDQGKIIALGTPRELIRTLGAEHVVEFSVDESQVPGLEKVLEQLNPAGGVERTEGIFRLRVDQLHVVLPELVQRVAAAGLTLTSLTTRAASLEDVFVKITGRKFDSSDAPPAPSRSRRRR